MAQAAFTVFQEDFISVEPRINDRIRVPEVRLVGPNGEQVGIVPIGKALDMALEADLDLVEVAPTARPPVAKIMDYGKFKYEAAQKAREARRNQVLTVIKEMKLRPKIDGHDYETKKGHVERFLKVGDKVKVTIMFRGREQSRPELGFRLLQRLAADVAELGFVESAPKQDGRNMIMVLAPHKQPAKAKLAPTEHHDRRADKAAAQVDAEEAPAPEAAAPVAAPEVSKLQFQTLPAEPVQPVAVAEPAAAPAVVEPAAAPAAAEPAAAPAAAEPVAPAAKPAAKPVARPKPATPTARPAAPRPPAPRPPVPKPAAPIAKPAPGSVSRMPSPKPAAPAAEPAPSAPTE